MSNEERKNKVLKSKYLPEDYKESYLKKLNKLREKDAKEEEGLNNILDSLNSKFVFKLK